LMDRLRRAPRRRDFKTVPMILQHRDSGTMKRSKRSSPIAARTSRCGTTPISRAHGST
jgi:hypothetical protein